MRRLLPVLVLALLAFVVVWWRNPGDEAEVARPEMAGPSVEREDAPMIPTPSPEAAEVVAAEAQPEAPPAADAPIAREAIDPAPDGSVEEVGSEIDRDERRKVFVLVIDTLDRLVPGASVEALAIRTRLGSVHKGPAHLTKRRGPGRTSTNAEGVAVIEYSVWAESQGDWWKTSEIALLVKHPDYVTADFFVSAAEMEATVMLAIGASVIVSGWIDSAGERIDAVQPVLCRDAEVTAEDWTDLGDGRLVCRKVPLGDHAVALEHERDGMTYTSAFTAFTLEEGEQEEIHLQLQPSRCLAGVLDDDVPRPVRDGRVVIHVLRSTGDDWGTHVSDFELSAHVETDGSFRLHGLPPGRIEIVGRCPGWTSAFVAEYPDEPAEYNQVVPPETIEGFILDMIRTAAAKITVLDPQGMPLENARVQALPQNRWRNGGGGAFFGRRWESITDSDGFAHLVDLPARAAESIGVDHPLYRLPEKENQWGIINRWEYFDLVPGKTSRLTVRMEEKDDK